MSGGRGIEGIEHRAMIPPFLALNNALTLSTGVLLVYFNHDLLICTYDASVQSSSM